LTRRLSQVRRKSALLFASAGTMHWPGAWVYLATNAVLGPVFGVWLVVPSPTAPKVVALNVSCIDGIELAKIAMTPVDGRNR
jgi:hypothetical protein